MRLELLPVAEFLKDNIGEVAARAFFKAEGHSEYIEFFQAVRKLILSTKCSCARHCHGEPHRPVIRHLITPRIWSRPLDKIHYLSLFILIHRLSTCVPSKRTWWVAIFVCCMSNSSSLTPST